jgi:hypothetical protein
LAGADRDQNLSAAGTNFNAAAATTGACAASDVGYGVRAEGVELEASLVPARNFRMAAGLTYAKTSYRDNLVGSKTGAPLDPALRKLPGDNLSNAPELVATSSVTWTPDIGSNGMSGLVYIDGRITTPVPTCSRKKNKMVSRFSTHVLVFAVLTNPGALSFGGRTFSIRIMRRSRSTRHSRRVQPRRHLWMGNIPVVAS